MVDIHCHLLYGVDDGPDSYEMSVRMLGDAADQGITHLILTPHYRRGMFRWNKSVISDGFRKLSGAAAAAGINIGIGCEYHADADMVYNLREGRVPALAGSEYVLTEFGHEDTADHARILLDELLAAGYIPVIAHAERYTMIRKDPAVADRFRQMGCLIQLNAGSILGSEGRTVKNTCKKLLTEDLADIVASDCHDMAKRRNRMKECRRYVEKRFGAGRALKLFETAPGRIVGISGE